MESEADGGLESEFGTRQSRTNSYADLEALQGLVKP